MTRYILSAFEAAITGFSHAWKITAADVAAIGASLTGTIDLIPLTAGQGIQAAAFRLVTNFSGGAVSSLTLEMGTSANPTDADGILDAYQVLNGASPVVAGDANGAFFATLRTGVYMVGAGTLQMFFTSVTANLNAITAGEALVFAKVVDLNRIQGTL